MDHGSYFFRGARFSNFRFGRFLGLFKKRLVFHEIVPHVARVVRRRLRSWRACSEREGGGRRAGGAARSGEAVAVLPSSPEGGPRDRRRDRATRAAAVSSGPG